MAGMFFGALFFWIYGLEGTAWRWILGVGVALFILSRVALPVMKPIHIAWMKFAFVLGWINTRIILGLFFYIVLTPIGLVMRVFRSDLLDQKFDAHAPSYWKRRTTPFDPSSMERQF
jgi:hypothetical protein